MAGAVRPSSLLAVATQSTISHRLHLTMTSKRTAVLWLCYFRATFGLPLYRESACHTCNEHLRALCRMHAAACTRASGMNSRALASSAVRSSPTSSPNFVCRSPWPLASSIGLLEKISPSSTNCTATLLVRLVTSTKPFLLWGRYERNRGRAASPLLACVFRPLLAGRVTAAASLALMGTISHLPFFLLRSQS